MFLRTQCIYGRTVVLQSEWHYGLSTNRGVGPFATLQPAR